jgi:hypothetical protein
METFNNKGEIIMPRKSLMELYLPRDADSQRLYNWHLNSSKTLVNDHERSSIPGSHDRVGNSREVYSGAVKPHDRNKTRQGYMPGDDVKVADLGRNTGVNRQGKPGNRGTVVRTPVYDFAKKDD